MSDLTALRKQCTPRGWGGRGIHATHNALRDYTTVYPLIANLEKRTVKTRALS